MTKMCRKRTWLSHVAFVVIVSGLVLISASPLSCRLTEDGITLVHTDALAPQVLSFAATAESTLSMVYSEAVTLESVTVRHCENEADASITAESAGEAIDASVTYDESGLCAQIELSSATEIGERYYFSCRVKDYSGNTLEYSRFFTGYNDHPARLLLSEVRFGHSPASAKLRKAEFIELYVLKSGNTAGISLCAGYYNNSYDFPVMEVAAGEYITVHTRTFYSDSVDETGSNLSLAMASPDASAGSRDLWINGDSAFFTKTDVIVLSNTADGSLLDALFVKENDTKTAWTRSNQKVLAEQAYAAGIWKYGSTPESAAISTSGLVRSLARQNIAALVAACSSEKDAAEAAFMPVSAEDWRIVASATPGSANSWQ